MYKLLIVDNETDICNNLKYLLDWSQYNISSIVSASSYVEAISCAVDYQPDIVLVDVNLDGYWGYDLVNHLRSIGLKSKFCMISGYDDFSFVQKSMKAGAQDYLLKPIDVCELQAYLRKVIVDELHGTIQDMPSQSTEIDPILHRPYSSFSKITNKLILIVKSNYREQLSLMSVAEMFSMSSKYIGRIFLKDTGLKFSEYLLIYRMRVAKNMIEGTRDKIATIAASVGYSQPNNFYVHFKRFFNISPNQLRGEKDEDFAEALLEEADRDNLAELLALDGGEAALSNEEV